MKPESTVTASYHRSWQEKRLAPKRMAAQLRAVGTFERLYGEILNTPLTGKILDIGCGDGTLVEAFNQNPSRQAQGIDISHGVNFERDPLPFEAATFDHAIMYSVIEHVQDPGKLLTETLRILKPSGTVLLITSNFDLSHPLIYDRYFYHDPTHVHPYNPVSLEHLMSLYHFKKEFIGLWTVGKPAWVWKLPMLMQFYLGALLPFSGATSWAPGFLKGKSRTMLCVFRKEANHVEG